uniref:prepilin peptidase n=1 Tax=Lachnoclostridium phocaeense TaxID=1871021 RepID=UPI0026DB5427|nr:prepilin peptidase [Lachnoclostridium phocaeense]
MRNIAVFAVLILFTLFAALYDRRSFRIPNQVVFPGMLAGLLLSDSLPELGLKLLALAALYLFGMTRLMEAGDLKLWMMVSCIIGFTDSCLIILFANLFLILKIYVEKPVETACLLKTVFVQLYSLKRMAIAKEKGYAFAPYVFCVTFVYVLIQIVRLMFL